MSAWIQIISEEEAQGPLKEYYAAAIKRSGRVFNIVKVMGLNPKQLQASMAFYISTMLAPHGSLPRALREMLAVVVSKANQCRY